MSDNKYLEHISHGRKGIGVYDILLESRKYLYIRVPFIVIDNALKIGFYYASIHVFHVLARGAQPRIRVHTISSIPDYAHQRGLAPNRNLFIHQHLSNCRLKIHTVVVILSHTYSIAHSRFVLLLPWRFSPIDFPKSIRYTVASFCAIVGS